MLVRKAGWFALFLGIHITEAADVIGAGAGLHATHKRFGKKAEKTLVSVNSSSGDPMSGLRVKVESGELDSAHAVEGERLQRSSFALASLIRYTKTLHEVAQNVTKLAESGFSEPITAVKDLHRARKAATKTYRSLTAEVRSTAWGLLKTSLVQQDLALKSGAFHHASSMRMAEQILNRADELEDQCRSLVDQMYDKAQEAAFDQLRASACVQVTDPTLQALSGGMHYLDTVGKPYPLAQILALLAVSATLFAVGSVLFGFATNKRRSHRKNVQPLLG